MSSPEGVVEASLTTLLQQSAAGDRDAFMELYDATSPRVYGVALRTLRSPVAAEKTTSAAYLELWRTARSFNPDRWRPMAWITVILHRAMKLPAASGLA
jgi:RNA polymerase sigma-70 factor (ECF subfamily)